MAYNTEIRKKIAKRLKQARENSGYSNAQVFCEINQLPYFEYLSYESGDKPIRASQANIYAKLLNISIHWLLVGL